MNLVFATDYQTILQNIEKVDPVQYGKTRNYIDGAVTYLSPYISRGVISTKLVLEIVLKKGYEPKDIEAFVKELCWRDYFQRVAQHKNVNLDIKHKQYPVTNDGIPVQILTAATGIEAIDRAINQLYSTGYMHNHCRMYTASLICNIAKSHWKNPAQWMYYHLLDGDWASNSCSWQWVAGANSNKKYVANQENINKYTLTHQTDTFLDVPYELIDQLEIPDSLTATEIFVGEVSLPETNISNIDVSLPTFIYNYYNLDPRWNLDIVGNRILLIDPDFFSQYPISQKCMDFMLALSKNIPGIQVFTGSFQSLVSTCRVDNVYFKEHPLNIGYYGHEEPRDWIVESVSGYYPSFFAYWRAIEKQLPNSL